MMINIRGKVFETNSSSTHSITITTNSSGIYDTIIPDNGVITLVGGQFGWEWEKYNDPLTKANYAAVYAQNNSNKLNTLINVIKDHTGAKEVVLDVSGYIDHDSINKADPAFVSAAQLKDWLFNSESWLFTGNDNEAAPPNFYDVEFGIEYNYQLSIDGLNLVEKFEDYPSNEKLKDSLYALASRHPVLKTDCSFHDKLPEYELWYEGFQDTSKKMHSSFDKLEENIIIFFEVEPVYTPKRRIFKGYIVNSTKEFKFEINKI